MTLSVAILTIAVHTHVGWNDA